MKRNVMLLVKGFIMGIANIIPGVSGGTLALTLGIYEEFIGAISNFFKNLKDNIKFLLPLGIGMVLSFWVLSDVIESSLSEFPLPTVLFFMGLVIGGLPMIFKRVSGKRDSKKIPNYLVMISTFSLIIFMSLLPMIFPSTSEVVLSNIDVGGMLLLVVVGAIAAATMIIPGISGSLVLLTLGFYRPILDTVSSLFAFENVFNNLLVVGSVGVGVLIGLVLVSKLIKRLFEKHETITMYAVIGFVVASLFAIPISTYFEVETFIFSVPQLLVGVVLLLIGYFIGNRLGDE